VKGILQFNRSITSSEVKTLIANEFNKNISETVINDFRRENDLTWIPLDTNIENWQKSGAAEIIIALAIKSGFIETIAQFIYAYVQKQKDDNDNRYFIISLTDKGKSLKMIISLYLKPN